MPTWWTPALQAALEETVERVCVRLEDECPDLSARLREDDWEVVANVVLLGFEAGAAAVLGV